MAWLRAAAFWTRSVSCGAVAFASLTLFCFARATQERRAATKAVLSFADARQLLPGTEIGRRPGDAARIPHADGGDGPRSRRAAGRGLLLSGARPAGEGRAQPRQARPGVRSRLQGPRTDGGGALGGDSVRVAEVARREISHRRRKEA